MRIVTLLAAAAMTSPAIAQMPVLRPSTAGQRVLRVSADIPRVGIGVTTTSNAGNRDTLGVLVAAVRPGSPADKAGIEEGNRIASINGVSLKLAAADVGEPEMANIMSRRLTRELEKLKVGDDVDLRIYANGQTKSVKVKTVAPEDFNEARRRAVEDRATLGLNIAITGSARDSIGVFVMSVEDGGPAAKAGIEEGSRIASINGVDLRVKRNTDEDEIVFRSSNVNRLERELSKVKPGDDVELRVYAGGQFRTVKVKAARMSDMPHHGRQITIMGGDNFSLPPMAATFPRIEINGAQLGDEVRRALENARGAAGMMPRISFGNRVVW
jgi:S1-C subfamily serine protease